jgi:hypothetical protein
MLLIFLMYFAECSELRNFDVKIPLHAADDDVGENVPD